MRVIDIISLKEELEIRPSTIMGADGKPSSWHVFDTDAKRAIQTFTGKDAEGRAEEFRDAERAKRNKSSKPDKSKDRPSKKDQARYRKNKVKQIEKYGNAFIWFLKAVGLFTAVYECWQDLEGIEEDYANGLFGEVGSETALLKMEYRKEFVIGALQAQVIIPRIPQIIASVPYISAVARFINWVTSGAGLIGGPAGAWVAVTKHVAVEIMIQFFQYWLGTEEGKNWLAEGLTGYIVRGTGSIERWGWNKITNAFKQWADAGNPDRPKPPVRDADKNIPANMDDYREGDAVVPANPKVKVIKGIPVTDEEGYLIPGIEDNVKIKVAVQDALDAGKPSPLEGIPRRPK